MTTIPIIEQSYGRSDDNIPLGDDAITQSEIDTAHIASIQDQSEIEAARIAAIRTQSEIEAAQRSNPEHVGVNRTSLANEVQNTAPAQQIHIQTDSQDSYDWHSAIRHHIVAWAREIDMNGASQSLVKFTELIRNETVLSGNHLTPGDRYYNSDVQREQIQDSQRVYYEQSRTEILSLLMDWDAVIQIHYPAVLSADISLGKPLYDKIAQIIAFISRALTTEQAQKYKAIFPQPQDSQRDIDHNVVEYPPTSERLNMISGTKEYSHGWTFWYWMTRILIRGCLPLVMATLIYIYASSQSLVEIIAYAISIVLTIVYWIGIEEKKETCSWKWRHLTRWHGPSWRNAINAFFGINKRVCWVLETEIGGRSPGASPLLNYRSVASVIAYFDDSGGEIVERRITYLIKVGN